MAVLDSGVVATADIDVSKRINLIPGDENIEPLLKISLDMVQRLQVLLQAKIMVMVLQE